MHLNENNNVCSPKKWAYFSHLEESNITNHQNQYYPYYRTYPIVEFSQPRFPALRCEFAFSVSHGEP